jgi:hypothetical protein
MAKVTGGSADGSTRTVAPDQAPTRPVPPGPTRWQGQCQLGLPTQTGQAVAPEGLVVAPPGRALLPRIGTNLSCWSIVT